MTPRISLALVLHNHQPVGNFGWVFAETYERAYLPMLEAIEQHPSIRIALHYSGALVEWIVAERPGFMRRLAALVGRGQVELLGGGWYEPVLAALPERDRVAQLRRMGDELERLTGRRPAGAWLAERVWEPDLPTSLVDAGYAWTVLDDEHLRAASVSDSDGWGAFATDDQGKRLNVFASQQELRYRIPFSKVDDVIAHLRANATEGGHRLAFMGDDGEKFGIWPTTWQHCWGEHAWVERFFTALEQSSGWLATVTPTAWLERERPIGRIYIPTSSYAEMGEWALAPADSTAFNRVLHRAVDEGRPEARWLRGGFWRNFQVRYREVNDLHKTMLAVSTKVAAMPEGPARTTALQHLHRGQANDAYWHGLFGGIYLADVRLAAWANLIAAEDAADGSTPGVPGDPLVADLDLDGIDEVLLPAPGQVVAVKLNEGAGIGRWEIRAVRHALTAVMRRRPEAYHETLLEHERRASEAALLNRPDGGGEAQPGAGGAISIHGQVRAREEGLSSRLVYDGHERRSGLVRLLDLAVLDGPIRDPKLAVNAGRHELGNLVDAAWSLVSLGPGRLEATCEGTVRAPGGTGTRADESTRAEGGAPGRLRVRKTIELGAHRRSPGLTLGIEVENVGETQLEAVLAIEWNLILLGGGGNPAAFHEIAGQRTTHDSPIAAEGVTELAAGNDLVGLTLRTRLSEPAFVLHAPIETVSNSEMGFERIHQGTCSLFAWPLRLEPGARRSLRIEQRVETSHDAAITHDAPITHDAAISR